MTADSHSLPPGVCHSPGPPRKPLNWGRGDLGVNRIVKESRDWGVGAEVWREDFCPISSVLNAECTVFCPLSEASCKCARDRSVFTLCISLCWYI